MKHHKKVYHGKELGIVRSKEGAGKIILKGEALNLKEAQIPLLRNRNAGDYAALLLDR